MNQQLIKRCFFYFLLLFPLFYLSSDAIMNSSDEMEFNINYVNAGILRFDGEYAWVEDKHDHFYYGTIDSNGNLFIDKDGADPIEFDSEDYPLHIKISPAKDITGKLLPLVYNKLNEGTLTLSTNLKIDVFVEDTNKLVCSVTMPVDASTENNFSVDGKDFGPGNYTNGEAMVYGQGLISSSSFCADLFTEFYIELGFETNPVIIGTGAYTNRVEIEPNDDSSTASFLPYYSKSIGGSISSSNHDFYSFYLQPNQTLNLASYTDLYDDGTYKSPLLSMTLKDKDGNLVASSYQVQDSDGDRNSNSFKSSYRPCWGSDCDYDDDDDNVEIIGTVYTYLDYKSNKTSNQKFILEVNSTGTSSTSSYKSTISFSTITKMYENSNEDSINYYNVPVEPNITEISGTLSSGESRDLYNFCMDAKSEIDLQVTKSQTTSLTYNLYYWDTSKTITISTKKNDNYNDTITWGNSFDRDWCFVLEIKKGSSSTVNYTIKRLTTSVETSCQDGIDNDDDGDVDCSDSDCGCSLESCTNGKDDDLDGKIDCNDPDCNGKTCNSCVQYVCVDWDGTGECTAGSCKNVNYSCSNNSCPKSTCMDFPECEKP